MGSKINIGQLAGGLAAAGYATAAGVGAYLCNEMTPDAAQHFYPVVGMDMSNKNIGQLTTGTLALNALGYGIIATRLFFESLIPARIEKMHRRS